MDACRYFPIPNFSGGKEPLNMTLRLVTVGEFARFVKERAYTTKLEKEFEDWESWRNSDWTGGSLGD